MPTFRHEILFKNRPREYTYYGGYRLHLGAYVFHDTLPQWRCFADPGSGPEGISLFLVGNSALLPLHH